MRNEITPVTTPAAHGVSRGQRHGGRSTRAARHYVHRTPPRPGRGVRPPLEAGGRAGRAWRAPPSLSPVQCCDGHADSGGDAAGRAPPQISGLRASRGGQAPVPQLSWGGAVSTSSRLRGACDPPAALGGSVCGPRKATASFPEGRGASSTGLVGSPRSWTAQPRPGQAGGSGTGVLSPTPVRPLSWTLVGASGSPAPRPHPPWSPAVSAMAVRWDPQVPGSFDVTGVLSPSEELKAMCAWALRL